MSEKELLEAFEPLDRIKFTEIILNHEVMFSKLMDSEIRLLGQETINKIHQLKSCPLEFVNQATIDTTTQVMARFISLSEEKGKTISAPRKINIDEPENVEWLISIVKTFISQK